jgi:hypothetical protein
VKLVMFCESHADHRMAATLIDRVLREEGPTWVGDLMDSGPAHVREWIEDGQRRSFFDIHSVLEYIPREDRLRLPRGHFNGKPGAADAQMARNAFFLVRYLQKKWNAGKPYDAVVIVRDMDDQGKLRRIGLDQARKEASTWAAFKIVYGCPDPEQETWLLASFEPESDEERARLDELRQELGFCPVREAHKLDATADGAKKNPKRVADKLMGTDAERRARCLHQPLGKLRELGTSSGLRDFLDEVNQRILPVLNQSRRQA